MDRKPNPSIEILTARLVNDLAENTKAVEKIEKLDEAKLLEKYGEKDDLPNVTTQQMLEGEKDTYEAVQNELNELLEGKTEDEVDLTDPRKVKKYFDRFVEGQEDAKKTVAIAFVDYMQNNIRKGVLLMGPSGSGKTYLLEILAKKAGIKVVKKSLANVSGEGYKGQNLSEGLEELLGEKKAILFLDEFDKIARGSSGEIGGFEEKLQNELLAYFTGEKIKLANAMPNPAEQKPEEEIEEEPEEDASKEQKQGADKKKVDVQNIKRAKLYNNASQIVDNGSAGGVVKGYLNSLISYLANRGIKCDMVDLTSGFEEIPRGVNTAIQRWNEGKYNRGRGRRKIPAPWAQGLGLDDDRNDDNDDDDSITNIDSYGQFVLQVGDRYYLNPKRKQLDRIFTEKEEKEEKEEEGTIEEKIEELVGGKDAKVKDDKKKKKNKDAEPEEKLPPNVIDMNKIMIVVAGAFHGNKASPSLYKIIQKRLGGNTCQLDETELLRNVEDKDLIEYGFKPEIVGRLQSRAVLKPHTVEGLYRILKYNEDSPLDRIKKNFEKIGVTISFDDPALLLLAQYAHEGIGVRGIHKALDDLTKDISFDRADYIGRIMHFTRSDLEKKLKKQVEFQKRDSYEVDWYNIHSIIGYLDLFVPKQEKAKIEIAKAFHLYHIKMNHKKGDLELPMANVMLVGQTGSGKTYMVDLLAKKAGLPIASTSTSGKVPESFQGTPLANVFEHFSETQKHGVVYIDEIDKVILNPENPLNNEFLAWFEKGEIRGRRTDDYLFITSGACQDLINMKKARGESTEITKDDLIKAGMREEVLGRIPILVNLEPPTLETMVKVLEGPDSVLTRFANYFETQKYVLTMEKGVSELIAEEALKSNLGFRALKTVTQKLFNEYIVHTKDYATKDNRVMVMKADVEKILRGEK